MGAPVLAAEPRRRYEESGCLVRPGLFAARKPAAWSRRPEPSAPGEVPAAPDLPVMGCI